MLKAANISLHNAIDLWDDIAVSKKEFDTKVASVTALAIGKSNEIPMLWLLDIPSFRSWSDH
jgi:hypothetical protein